MSLPATPRNNGPGPVHLIPEVFKYMRGQRDGTIGLVYSDSTSLGDCRMMTA